MSQSSRSFFRLAQMLGAGLFTTVCVGGIALADGGAGGAAQPQDAVVDELTKKAELALNEFVPEGQKLTGKIQLNRQEVANLLKEARASRDPVKVVCLNPKLTEIDVALKNAKERLEQLDQAVKAANKDDAKHHYEIILRVAQTADGKTKEARLCIGTKELFTDTKTQVTGGPDPKIPDDPDYPNLLPVTNVPGCVSCFN